MTFKLMLDPGHGGSDPGARANGMVEKDLNLEISRIVAGILMAEYVVEIDFTRLHDEFVSLQKRVALAKEKNVDWFFSIHCNAHSSPDANGYEDFIHTNASGKSQHLRNKFHPDVAAVWQRYGRTNRGRKTANFFVLRETAMPAMLVECGFLTNAGDAALLRNDEFFDVLCSQMAHSIAEAAGLPARKPLINYGETVRELKNHVTAVNEYMLLITERQKKIEELVEKLHEL